MQLTCLEGMSARNNPLPDHGQQRRATPASPRHASASSAAGTQFVNLQYLTLPVPAKKDEALQKAIQNCIDALSDEDKAALRPAPDDLERLQEIQCNGKSPIPSFPTPCVEKLLQFFENFMGSLAIFFQQSPEISSLVVGGVNCILTVGSNNAIL